MFIRGTKHDIYEQALYLVATYLKRRLKNYILYFQIKIFQLASKKPGRLSR